MVWQLPIAWMVALDFVAWAAIHLGVAYAVTQVPVSLFRPGAWLYRARSWEAQGRRYEQWFRVNRWKKLLPDGAALFRRGFRKKRFVSKSPAYLRRFMLETCRGELVHWIVFAFAPVFFLWNPPHVGLVMILYAALANLPFIIVQRYNRFRLLRLLGDTGWEPESRAAAISNAQT